MAFSRKIASIPVSKVEVHISCKDLLNKDLTSKSDPMCVMYLQDNKKWYEVSPLPVLHCIISLIFWYIILVWKNREHKEYIKPGFRYNFWSRLLLWRSTTSQASSVRYRQQDSWSKRRWLSWRNWMYSWSGNVGLRSI